MKTYTCHKTVKAGKIVAIDVDKTAGMDRVNLTLDDGEVHPVSGMWSVQKEPKVGGYLVEYEDGYLSWSPAKAFEDGYTEVAEEF